MLLLGVLLILLGAFVGSFGGFVGALGGVCWCFLGCFTAFGVFAGASNPDASLRNLCFGWMALVGWLWWPLEVMADFWKERDHCKAETPSAWNSALQECPILTTQGGRALGSMGLQSAMGRVPTELCPSPQPTNSSPGPDPPSSRCSTRCGSVQPPRPPATHTPLCWSAAHRAHCPPSPGHPTATATTPGPTPPPAPARSRRSPGGSLRAGEALSGFVP